MIVKFSEVGSPPKSWAADLPNLEPDTMVRSIRKNNALYSRSIDFSWDEESQEGIVWVGDVRPVGRFTVQDRYIMLLEDGGYQVLTGKPEVVSGGTVVTVRMEPPSGRPEPVEDLGDPADSVAVALFGNLGG